MATYPPVGERERDAALARIAARHRRREDARWSEAGTEARDVLSYLRRRRAGQPLPAQLAADDAWDELVLSAWLHWDERRRELELLHSALRRGLSLAGVGRYLGLATRQGTRDHLDRLQTLLADHHRYATGPRRPAEGDGATDALAVWAGSTRAARAADVHAARSTRDRRQSWIDTGHHRIAATIAGLLRGTQHAGIVRDGQSDLADYLDWLAEDDEGATFSPATFATLGLVLGELRGDPAVISQASNHTVRTAIRAADQLRADYAALR